MRWSTGLALLLWLMLSSTGFAQKLPRLSWDVGPQAHRTRISLKFEGFVRPEWMTNRSDYSFGSEDSDAYVASRIRLTGDVLYRNSVGLHVTLQDSRYWGNGLPQGGAVRFSTEASESFTRNVFFGVQLYEAYMYLRWMQGEVEFKAGRMKVVYGDSFFIGDPGFLPPGQSFDGMRLRVQRGTLKVDLLWLMVRESVATTQRADCEGRCYWEGDHLAGMYATKRWTRRHTTDVYGFYYQRAPRSDTLTEPSRLAFLGVRYLLQHSILRFSMEGQLQVGRHLSRDLLAGAGLVKLRATFPVPTRPFIGVQGMFATGDGDPTDTAENNFLALFQNRRRFYGLVNLYGLSNIIQPMVEVGLRPHKQVSLTVDFRYTWKMNAKGTMVAGGSHNRSLADLTGEDGQDVGSELNLRLKYSPFPGITFDLGGGVFLPSRELHQRGVDGTITKTFGQDPAFMVFLNIWLKWG